VGNNEKGAADEAAPTLLVVDDNPDITSSVSRLMGMYGVQVRTAHSSGEALRVAFSHPPDVILLDLELGSVSGYEVALALRAQPQLANTKIIAYSGVNPEEHRDKLKQGGFAGFVGKGGDVDGLLQVLAQALGVGRLSKIRRGPRADVGSP
jgi:two-component system CheB/CheR fusion protein